MIGIVVVSHSARLAEAAVELALQMVHDEAPRIEVAAGAADGVLGTDATRVAAAIEAVAGNDGVLVITDLGSAVLSAELGREFVSAPAGAIVLSAAPFVEGLVAAVVRAAAGGSLDDVEAEARDALAAKRAQLADTAGDGDADAGSAGAVEPGAPAVGTPGAPAPGAPGEADAAPRSGSASQFTLRNPSGLHARPVAMLVSALAGLDARVTVANPARGRGPVRGDSTIALLTLGAVQGDTISVEATGPDAERALAAVAALVEDGFGELDGGAPPG